jgi:hypothetical protein
VEDSRRLVGHPYHFGIDQGPVVLMIENYRSGLIWDIMRRCPAVIAGLRRAGSPAAGCEGFSCPS